MQVVCYKMKNNNQKLNQKGDTIIEVILAAAVITLVLFTSWSLVNRSTQLSLAARKRVEMVNQLKEQAEVLQAKRAANPTGFLDDLTTYANIANPEANPCDSLDMNSPTSQPPQSFYLSAAGSTVAPVSGVKKVKLADNSRIWIQKQQNASYVDFYIRGCWLSGGSVQKTENAHMVVRLNL